MVLTQIWTFEIQNSSEVENNSTTSFLKKKLPKFIFSNNLDTDAGICSYKKDLYENLRQNINFYFSYKTNCQSKTFKKLIFLK